MIRPAPLTVAASSGDLPVVLEVVPGGPADLAGIRPGDELVRVDGVVPTDVVDYQQLVDDGDPRLSLRRRGVEIEVVVAKRPGEPLGLRLNRSIFDRVQTCDNHCSFCFIYQLPPGLRQSLYLKDDDYRLSFLYGNFTTLTRFTELDLARVVDERLGPLYVSIHATDPEVRADMLRNPRGGTSLRWLAALLEAGIEVHGQIVLCPGINDGPVLERTFAEILLRYRRLADVGVVPVGVSRWNREEGLRPHTSAEARRDVGVVHRWQEEALRRLGRRMFFASDELYLRAGVTLPSAEAYEGYPQHENGIGMTRAFLEELEALERGRGPSTPPPTGEWVRLPAAPAEGYRASRTGGAAAVGDGPAVLVTGGYGKRVLGPVLRRLERLTGRAVRLLVVENRFFGGNVAVAGLLTGADLAAALRADDGPASVYLLPDVALSGDRFLDDTTVAEVAEAAGAPLVPVPPTPAAILGALAA